MLTPPYGEKDNFVGRRKLYKRQSGLMKHSIRRDELCPRAGSPVPAGSPILRENVVARDDDDDEGEEEEEEEEEGEDVTVPSTEHLTWTRKTADDSVLKARNLLESEISDGGTERRLKDKRAMVQQLKSETDGNKGWTLKDHEDSSNELQLLGSGEEGKLKDVTNSTGSRMVDSVLCSSGSSPAFLLYMFLNNKII
jgi:hypothetical protein